MFKNNLAGWEKQKLEISYFTAQKQKW